MSRAAGFAADMWLAEREGPAGLTRRRRRRLAALLSHARTASPFYRHRYRHLPATDVRLTDVPPTSKPELMAEFDDWVTDPAVTRASVEAFVADPGRSGQPFTGGAFVCTSSGSTGHPGLFVHDARAVAVYWANPLVRGYGQWLGMRALADLLRRGAREAQVIGTSGHFGGMAWAERARRRSGTSRRALGVFSADSSLPDLDRALTTFAPAVLAGYPTALDLLAAEQNEGRLDLDLLLVATSGETASPQLQRRLADAFGCMVRESYACSEALFLAHSCAAGWLHLSSDWYVLEPVGWDGSPTPAGRWSDTVLLTNLANRLQPVIRYDLGDSVCFRPDPCPCGSPLPALRVAGRSAETLVLVDAVGQPVPVIPLVLSAAVDAVPGALLTQIAQTGADRLAVRFGTEPGADDTTVWTRLQGRLGAALTRLGLENVVVTRDPTPPEALGPSGKFRRIAPGHYSQVFRL